MSLVCNDGCAVHMSHMTKSYDNKNFNPAEKLQE